MIKSNFQWNGARVLAVSVDGAWERLVRVVLYYQQAVMLALNVPNTGRRVAFTDRTGKRRTRTVYDNPSRPGEPPHKVTGNLQGNVLVEFVRDLLRAKVGLGRNAYYGLFLELDTRFIKDRSFLLRTLRNVFPQLQALAAQRG